MFGIQRHNLIQIGAKSDPPLTPLAFELHFHSQERHIVHPDAHLFHRRDQNIGIIGFAAQNPGKKLYHGNAVDRRAHVIPAPIAGDAHVDIAAEFRVPEMNRRALALNGYAVAAETGDHILEKRGGIGLLVHCLSVLSLRFYYIIADMQNLSDAADQILPEIERLGGRLGAAKEAIERVIFGQGAVVEETLVTLLAGGHGLLVGVPGLAKTKLVETLARVLGLDARRVQFTPDLMPADILGSEVLEESDSGRRSFRFISGPIFCQLLMADEINRASPRTQSALLQAMQERQVSVAGTRHDLPAPFHVLATQNPLEQEGTYPLPEAQLDRFLLQIDVRYPNREAERRMLFATTGANEETIPTILNAGELIAAQRLVRRVPVGESVVEAILDLVRSGRPDESNVAGIRDLVAWGPGPRASQALMLAVRARALLQGRLAPSIEDVLALAGPVLRHRMALTFAARAEGVNVADVIDRLTGPLR